MTPEPLPSLAALLAEADRVEYDALALRRAFPRAVARVLHIAARSGSVGRRAASLNTELARAGVARRITLTPTEPPLRVVDAMWASILDTDPVDARDSGVRSTTSDARGGRHGPPHGRHEAVGIEAGQAGGEASVPILGPSRRSREVRASESRDLASCIQVKQP